MPREIIVINQIGILTIQRWRLLIFKKHAWLAYYMMLSMILMLMMMLLIVTKCGRLTYQLFQLFPPQGFLLGTAEIWDVSVSASMKSSSTPSSPPSSSAAAARMHTYGFHRHLLLLQRLDRQSNEKYYHKFGNLISKYDRICEKCASLKVKDFPQDTLPTFPTVSHYTDLFPPKLLFRHQKTP